MVWAGILGILVGLLLDLKLSDVIPSWLRHAVGLQKRRRIVTLLQDHFAPMALDDLVVSERTFPYRVRADLQRALDTLCPGTGRQIHFSGVQCETHYGSFADHPHPLPDPDRAVGSARKTSVSSGDPAGGSRGARSTSSQRRAVGL